jgi:hypothetical protein
MPRRLRPVPQFCKDGFPNLSRWLESFDRQMWFSFVSRFDREYLRAVEYNRRHGIELVDDDD